MKYYGWNLQDLRKKQENDTTPKTTQEIAIRQVYQEMMDDCQQIETIPEEISQSQFRKAIGHFNPSYYKEEIDAILYFCHQILPIDIQLQRPLPIDYTEEDIINGARIYMQKNEPHDYNYFKKIVSNKERIHFQYTAPKTTFLGKSYFLSRDEYYILINQVKGVQDAATLLHECSHIENYLKYGMNLSVYFAELQPMTREFYGFDSFRSYRATEETEKERLLALNRYLMKTLKLHQALTFLLTLKKSPSILKQPVQKFDACCQCYDIPYLYSLLTGDMEKEIGYALSFIASLDIYNHSSAEKSNLFITSYQIGTRKLNAKIIDRVITYLMDTFHTNPKIKQ